MPYQNPIYPLSKQTIDYVAKQLNTLVDALYGSENDNSNELIEPNIYYYGKGACTLVIPANPVSRCALITGNISIDSNTLSGNSYYQGLIAQNIPTSAMTNNDYIAQCTSTSDFPLSRFDEFVNNYSSFSPSGTWHRSGNVLWFSDYSHYCPSTWFMFWEQTGSSYQQYIDMPDTSYNRTLPEVWDDATYYDWVTHTSGTVNSDWGLSPVSNVSSVQNIYPLSDSRSIDYNGVTYAYSYDTATNSLYLNPQSDYTYNDYQYVFDNYILPYVKDVAPDSVQPDASFPDYDIIKYQDAEYNISLVDGLPVVPELSDDYQTYLSDDGGVIASFSTCSELFQWLFDVMDNVGVLSAALFGCIVCLIIKNLRGD